MRRLLFLVLLVGALSAPRVANAQDCDATDYLDASQSDLDDLNAAFNAGTLTYPELYAAVAELRREYEDMEDVPACAESYHDLVLAYLANVQDFVFFSFVGEFSDIPFEESELAALLTERLLEYATAIEQEGGRLAGAD